MSGRYRVISLLYSEYTGKIQGYRVYTGLCMGKITAACMLCITFRTDALLAPRNGGMGRGQASIMIPLPRCPFPQENASLNVLHPAR